MPSLARDAFSWVRTETNLNKGAMKIISIKRARVAPRFSKKSSVVQLNKISISKSIKYYLFSVNSSISPIVKNTSIDEPGASSLRMCSATMVWSVINPLLVYILNSSI